MRTKTLLLTAALAAAGVATSLAQTVYSVNAVGYVSVPCAVGFTMVANPLRAGTNTVGALIRPAVEDVVNVYKYNESTLVLDTFTYLGASAGYVDEVEVANTTLNPGEGVIINASAGFNIVFTGDVEQSNNNVGGIVSNGQPSGFSIRGSKIPQRGSTGFLGLDAALDASGNTVVNLYKYGAVDHQNYETWLYLGGGAWSGPDVEPILEVGEGFWMSLTGPNPWNRTFSVSP